MVWSRTHGSPDRWGLSGEMGEAGMGTLGLPPIVSVNLKFLETVKSIG